MMIKLWDLPTTPAQFDDQTRAILFRIMVGTTSLICIVTPYTIRLGQEALTLTSLGDLFYKSEELAILTDDQATFFLFHDHGMDLEATWATYGADGFPSYLLDLIHQVHRSGDRPLTINGPWATFRKALIANSTSTSHRIVIKSATPFAPLSIYPDLNHKELVKELLEAYCPTGWIVRHYHYIGIARFCLNMNGVASAELSGHIQAETVATVASAIKKATRQRRIPTHGKMTTRI